MSVAANVGVIAKASAREDFTVLQPASGSDAAVERKVFDCLQLHLDSGGRTSAFLFQHGTGVWFCRVEIESGTDTAGRARSRCTFLQLPQEWKLEKGLSLLETTQVNLEEVLSEKLREVEPVVTPSARRAVLNLLITNEVPTVRGLAEAVWVSQAWGDDPDLGWMQSAGSAPTRARFGRLLVIAGESRTPLREVRELEDRLGERDVPALGALRRVPDPQRRRHLLEAWLSQADPKGAETSAGEREWLFCAGYDRARWLQSIGAAERRDWLARGLLTFPEVEGLRDRWTVDDEPALAAFLGGCGADGLTLYIACARPRPEQVLNALRAAEANAFAALMGGRPLEETEQLHIILHDLERARALDTLGLPLLSAALRRQPRLEFRAAWVRALVRGGLPEVVALALAGAPQPLVAPVEQPVLQPSASWLGAVSLDALRNAAPWALKAPAWKRWWVAALTQHPDGGDYAPSLEGFYHPETLLWLASEVREGVAADVALKTLGRWLNLTGRSRPERAGVEYLLQECGFRRADAWASFLDGGEFPRDRRLTDAEEAEWTELCRAGLVSLARAVEAVGAGANSHCLCEFLQGPALDLLGPNDAEARPCSPQPPSEWRDEVTPLLSAAACKSEFWKRWGENGVPDAMLVWLGVKLAGTPGGVYAAALRAGEGGEPLRPEILRVVAGGLSRAARVEQAAQWAFADEGPEVMTMLAARCPHPAIEWLRGRLNIWQFGQPLPADLKPRELLALLPWLDPVTAVATAMSSPRGDLWEEKLFEQLLVMAKTSSQRGSPPPPEAVLERWADWCSKLASIPGWGTWESALHSRGTAPSQTSGPYVHQENQP